MIARAVWLLLAAALTLMTEGCVHVTKPENLSPSDFVGCYRLNMTPWKPKRTGGSTWDVTPPVAIRLTLRPETAWGGGYVVEPALGAEATNHHSPYWNLKDETVNISWTTGFTGLRMKLIPTTIGLKGTAKTFSDDGSYHESSDVVATRMPCE